MRYTGKKNEKHRLIISLCFVNSLKSMPFSAITIAHTHTTVHPHYTLHTTTPKRRAFRINETIHNISLCLTGTWCENDAHYYLFTASFMLIMWNGISFIACILFELKNVLLFTYFVDSIFSCFNLTVCVELVFRFHFGERVHTLIRSTAHCRPMSNGHFIITASGPYFHFSK